MERTARSRPLRGGGARRDRGAPPPARGASCSTSRSPSPTAPAASPATTWSRRSSCASCATRCWSRSPTAPCSTRRRRSRGSPSPPTPSSCGRCSSPAATSASWRSTGRSTTWRWRARARCASPPASSSRRASPVADLRADRQPRWRAAARAAGVQVATGDTKVVERGKADGLYINTSGVGAHRARPRPRRGAIQAGDRVLVSGPIGDHGMAIMIARGELELEVELESTPRRSTSSLATLLERRPDGVRCLRDPTRGGLATVLAELALAAELGITIDEAALPMRPEVNGACEILGHRPPLRRQRGQAGRRGCARGRGRRAGRAALPSRSGPRRSRVAEVRPEPPGLVLLETAFGGSRVVDMLAGDPLPRIC